MRLDRIDIAMAEAEAVPALADLREHGVAGAVGTVVRLDGDDVIFLHADLGPASEAGTNHVAPLTWFAAHPQMDVVMITGRWNLVDLRADPILDACAAAGGRHWPRLRSAPSCSPRI